MNECQAFDKHSALLQHLKRCPNFKGLWDKQLRCTHVMNFLAALLSNYNGGLVFTGSTAPAVVEVMLGSI